ncbi:hypothetical protein GCM10010971_39600 [Silvimonas amylolytica]|uniref:Uncharacterized protein n=1 Tax=Silvimonas amylolytica TaxID=449663 RepID=A0ABQ2PS16_9NEIS|nr:hypothetical protein GCM10010971_39600 [Silvimonas amylolytica]
MAATLRHRDAQAVPGEIGRDEFADFAVVIHDQNVIDMGIHERLQMQTNGTTADKMAVYGADPAGVCCIVVSAGICTLWYRAMTQALRAAGMPFGREPALRPRRRQLA